MNLRRVIIKDKTIVYDDKTYIVSAEKIADSCEGCCFKNSGRICPEQAEEYKWSCLSSHRYDEVSKILIKV